MAELKALEATIEQQKAHGLVIEEIDPALADPSPYSGSRHSLSSR